MSKLLPPILAMPVLAVIALISVWTGQPLLAPSLGSAAFTQILSPRIPSAAPYSVGVGQLAGLVGGLIGVYVASAAAVPSFMGDHPLTYARVLAVAIAVLVGCALQVALKATSPAGGSTALVVALGAETADWAGALRLVVGIVLVTALGEAARRAVLHWAPERDGRGKLPERARGAGSA